MVDGGRWAMTTFSLRERGWRDGFWGREAQEVDEVYLEGWECGRRAGDRTAPHDVEEPAESREEQEQ